VRTEDDPASLLHPAPDRTLRTWPVDQRVGNPRNNGAEPIKPIEIAM
jgi:putative SOS response-associated peptidase YedK